MVSTQIIFLSFSVRVKAIVDVEIQIEALTGQVKASQNHPERNRVGVKAGLAEGSASELAMSKFISS